MLTHIRLYCNPWTIAKQAPQYMGFPRQEYLSGLLFPSPGDLPDPGTEPMSPELAGRFFTTELPENPIYICVYWGAPGAGDGQGSLACCSPWGCKESDMTKRLN